MIPITHQSNKIIPNILIDSQFSNELLGTFKLKAAVYHSGDSPNGGHYKSSFKYNDQLFTTSDTNPNAKLELDDIPYLVIYERDAPELPIVIANKVDTINELNNASKVDFHIDSLIDAEKANRDNLLK